MMPDPLPVVEVTDTAVAAPVADEKPAPPIEDKPTTQPSVADALAASRQAHTLYHQHSPRMAAVPGSATPVLQQGDAGQAFAALKRAAAARAYAELLDPTHQDPAWLEDSRTMPAQEILVYYLQELAK